MLRLGCLRIYLFFIDYSLMLFDYCVYPTRYQLDTYLNYGRVSMLLPSSLFFLFTWLCFHNLFVCLVFSFFFLFLYLVPFLSLSISVASERQTCDDIHSESQSVKNNQKFLIRDSVVCQSV